MRADPVLAAFLTAAALSAACSSRPAPPRPAPVALSPAGVARPSPPAPRHLSLPPSPLGDEERILHALNRLTYGPRPGDVEDVRRIGLQAWIERQLGPAQVTDGGVEAQLRGLPTLVMSTSELLRHYPRPDPAAARPPGEGMARPPETSRRTPESVLDSNRPGRIVAELQAARIARAVWSERQLEEVMVDFWFNHFNVFAGKDAVRWMVTSYERDAIRPHVLGR